MKNRSEQKITIFSFIRYLWNYQPYRLVIMVSALTVGTFLEGIGVALLLPLLELISGEGKAASGSIKFLNGLGIDLTIETALSIIVGVFVVQAAVMIYKTKITEQLRMSFMSELALSTYNSVLNADWSFFINKKTGYIVNTLTEEVNRSGKAFFILNSILSITAVLIVYFVIAAVLSLKMTIMIFVLGICVFFLFRKVVNNADMYGRLVTENNNNAASHIVEMVQAAKVIKANTAEAGTLKKLKHHIAALEQNRFKSAFYSEAIRLLYEPIIIIALCLFVFIAVSFFAIPVSRLVIIFFVFYRIAPRLSNLQAFIHHLKVELPAFETVQRLKEEAMNACGDKGKGVPYTGLSREIVMDSVSFSYNKNNSEELKELSLSIRKGQFVAVIGGSGAGKTTVIDLLLGLLMPSSGKIEVDGVNLHDMSKEAWLNKIGYVAQETVLFDESIKSNIEWPYENYSTSQIVSAAKMAYADEFISSLPNRYDTIIGERGIKLSGGQRQRIALARALLRKPDILILDEATSSLDAESEKAIQLAIEAIAGELTIVAVAHRLATVKRADLIYVLEQGRVVENGTWNDLCDKEGRFEQLRKLQTVG